jgi:hypothetical protein
MSAAPNKRIPRKDRFDIAIPFYLIFAGLNVTASSFHPA